MPPTTDATRETRFSAEQHGNAYPPGIEHLYWHRARNRILYRTLRPHLRPGEPVLEIGCGSGVVVSYLRAQGVECAGVDLTMEANVAQGADGHIRLGTDAFALPADERDRVRILLLLDVLEHLPDPGAFLHRLDAAFPSVHHVLVTLPARTELWSNYDTYYGHYRRYELGSLGELGAPASFELVHAGYFFHLLYWAGLVAKRITRERKIVVTAPGLPRLHDLLGRLFSWEERLMASSWPGSSLYAVYERRV
jgi:hypothetical protein